MKPVATAGPDLVSIEELDKRILDLCTRINVATYELLLIREFEERAGFLKWGLQNCSEWLAWRCDLSMTTAREKVRVARARKDLPLEAGELVEKALDRARDGECLQVPDLVDTSWLTRQADAFVTLLKEHLQDNTDKAAGGSDNYLVTIHVDQSGLAGNEGRSALPIESVKRLCCDSQAVVLTEAAGQPLSIGRKSRIVPRPVERAVRARDHDRCVFPGCENRRFLHCHHIEHWASGGETSLDNLMLLCTKHHALVHEGGFRIEKNYLDRWHFVRPDGIAVPDCGYHSRDMIDDAVSTAYENPPAGGLLSNAEEMVREEPPPASLH